MGSQEPFDRLRWVVASLREHCPWTAGLTHESLTRYLVEEAHEAAEEIAAGSTGDDLRKELGDILLQVMLHAVIAEERGEFDVDGVVEAITDKLVRRSPHVFDADGTLNPRRASTEEIHAAWERIKAREKAAARDSGHQGRDAVVPSSDASGPDLQ